VVTIDINLVEYVAEVFVCDGTRLHQAVDAFNELLFVNTSVVVNIKLFVHYFHTDVVPLHVLRNLRKIVANYVIHPAVLLICSPLICRFWCKVFQKLLQHRNSNFTRSSGGILERLEKFVAVFGNKSLILKLSLKRSDQHITVNSILLQLEHLS